ncbi:hypothetical protein SEA_ADNAMA_134 [Mycobacterium phage Adnama]|uniref:Uncharacterized protein n=2 Tax=Viruses TaxID=10239 RepID=A0AAU8GR97_9VIRU|nr:hypothetical protein SEA_GOLDILOCKS_135 [Mycobacterium phage Goldilocks]AVE00164.1 hypothetical protein SEA_KIMCHI_135 [Mycobacterium phage Kimchi]AXC35975.1 hypothetical protein SEA_ADNAMA_134 [Mycobacterium phage Adnama]AXQ63724.1 hypothetical protein SEA_EASY2SAY_131 [Mycobacterium phage Easy2Say]AYD83844.1 hypothetical protein SEA_GEMINI_135 [Mycobacterium phage Gemini]QBJ05029.1 hypothetical protein SEA_MOLDEMORT_132 [Mycobacterium phage Moldemort]QCG78091.1 hypothetical protein SEA_L
MSTIVETIHHGDYHNVRTGEASTYTEFVSFLQASPYAGTATRADNKHVRESWDSLLATGRSEFGWATLEIQP